MTIIGSRTLVDKLMVNLEKRQKKKGGGGDKYVLLAALNDTFFWTFWTAGFLKVKSYLSKRTLVIWRLS